MSYINKAKPGWLLFFYSVPSKPVCSRMKVWRKLLKAGALPFKGAAYILPHTDEHYEFLQWLVSEVVSLGGESALVAAEKIETAEDREIIELFNQQREKDYRAIGKELEELERKINSIKKGSAALEDSKIIEQLGRLSRECEEAGKIDFFPSRAGRELQKRVKFLEADIRELSGIEIKSKSIGIVSRRTGEYQGRTWVTRKKPFVDRMASAWLIRKFIDSKAVFTFIDQREGSSGAGNTIFFDIRGGEFTHAGDLCTFEVLIKAFGIRDKAVKKIAETVHELDIKDDKFGNPSARGLEDILTGIRKTAKDDRDALEKGMSVFEMLYASKTQ
jgi:hypothetical protein